MRSQHNIIIGADLSGMRKEVSTIGALFKTQFALQAAGYAAQLAQELAQIAQEAERVNKALKFAGGGEATIKRLAAATGGLVSNLDLAAVAAESLAKGIGQDLLDEVAAFATTFSLQTGQTFAEAYKKAETAFINPTKESFRALGLDFQAYTDLITQGLDSQTAAAQVFIDKMKELGPAEGGPGMAAQQTRVAWENLKEDTATWMQDVVVGTVAGFAAMGRMATSLDAWMQGYLATQRQILAEWNKAPVLQYGAMIGTQDGMPFDFTQAGGTPGYKPPKVTPTRGPNESPVRLAAKEMEAFTVSLEANTQAIRENNMEGQAILDNYEAMQEEIRKTNAVIDYFGNAFSQAFEAALFSGEDFFKVMGEYLEALIKRLIAALVAAFALKALLSAAGLGAGKSIFDIFSSLAGIPKLAEGGLVTKPTLALIGERGPEAVVPLGRAGMAGGGPMEVASVRVSGADLLLAIRRAEYGQNRTGTTYSY